MRVKNAAKVIVLFVALSAPLIFSHPALAANAAPEVSQIESFMKNVVQVLIVIAGFVAAIFIAISGYTYITSSGNPEKLEKAKSTLIHSAIGLVIVIAAFVITNLVSNAAKGSFGG